LQQSGSLVLLHLDHNAILMSHRGPLRGNGHRFPHIKALSDGMVINFLMFALRPSMTQWSLISLH